ncbi:MAG: hypothetical protein JNK48_04690, partial [Bryobacterales bacterium]|nr:hypothetical protein [Bryobacterales bacterium]
SVQLTASSANFQNWSGDLTGSTNPQNLTMNGPRSVTANFSTGASITVTTNPIGRTFTVDGTPYSSTQVFNWTPGSQHTIATSSPQSSGGTRYTFSNWSDAGAISHSITTPASATTYTASFTTQYLLTTAVSPNGSGTITASPSSGDGYYNAGASVQLTASSANFQNWSGDLTGATNPQNLTMNGPRSVTANYSSPGISITVTTSPIGRTFTVDGSTYSSPQVFSWTQGSQHTIATSSPQSGGGTRYTFSNWSDAGAISHSIATPASATTYTANFTTQYLLTTAVSPNGSGTITTNPSSADGYYNAGAVVQLTASASNFQNWSGDLTGVANPQNVTMNGPRSTIANYTSGGSTCTFNVPQSTYNVPATAFTGNFPVTANCVYAPATQTSWIHILSSANESPVRYSVDRNTGAARVGSITIGTAAVTIVQDAAPSLSNALRFVSLEPCRLMETRPEYNFQGRTGAFGPPYMQANESRTLTPSQSNVCTIPADAKAYVLNVTLVPRGGVDHITIWPAGQSRPNFWTVRSPDAQIVANAAIVAAGTAGAIQVFASNDADLIIDIAGYFTDSAATSNLVFYPLTPCRVIDTRIDYRQPAGPFGPPSLNAQVKRTFQFPAGPYCTIPANARAFSVSLTAVPKGPLQFMTIWPAGGPQPNVSSINSPSGRIIANSVIVPASANGSIDVYAFNETDFLIDINGYFAPDDGQTGLFFYTAPQCRISDAAYDSESTRTIGIAASGQCLNIPSSAKAFALNFTSISNGSPMPFLTAFPTGQPQPNASVLNAFQGQTVSNSAIIPSGPNGQVNVFAYRPTQVVVELSGYFNR